MARRTGYGQGWNEEGARCWKCMEWLPLTEFSPRTDPTYQRPVRSHCRTCECDELKARAKAQPKKHNARSLVQYHLRQGNIARGTCEVCGVPNAHAHHDDYDKPNEVRWLCPRHHNQLHARLKANGVT